MTDDIPKEYKNLKCLRVEENSHRIIFLYYKQYPKENSTRFPQKLSAIFFYFDIELDEKFFYLYCSLVGQVDEVELGSFFNRRGSKNKRKIVNFAIVKYTEEDSLKNLLDQHETQRKVNDYLENQRNRRINLHYDPLKSDEEDNNGKPDDDGFITIRRKKKATDDLDEDIVNAGRRKKKKDKKEFYWNYQLLDKKKQCKFIF